LDYGGREGRSPNENFDGALYLSNNPDVVDSGQNPLIHYILFGQAEGRPTLATQEESLSQNDSKRIIPTPKELTVEDIEPATRGFGKPLVSVVIPVFANKVLTLRCLASVLQAKNLIAYEILVIDDCSPDEEISIALENMERRGWLKLIKNEKNLGFVFTANLGITSTGSKDVVLLNSDTEVYDGWLDRLHKAAYKQDNIACVTPLSNNATICSYPRFLQDNPYGLEISFADLDTLSALINKNLTVEAPTGVGFCMYMRRSAIERVGAFDLESFGKGYGEENDWCQRAKKAELLNIIAADVFVQHHGSASFQGEKHERITQALQVLKHKHPDYDLQIKQFIRDDPLLQARRNLDWARLTKHCQHKNVLIVCHNRGGGTERQIQLMTSSFSQMGVGVFSLRPVKREPSHVQIKHQLCVDLPSIPSFQLSDVETLSQTLADLRITEIHVHGLVDFAEQAPIHITKLGMALRAPLHIHVHDYTVICPRINLIDEDGIYCGEPDSVSCNTCLGRRGNDFGARSIENWRANNQQLLLAATAINVPNPDCSIRLSRYFPGLDFTVNPHERDMTIPQTIWTPPKSGEKIRIIILGALGKMKGFEPLLQCAKHAKRKHLPLEFILMGYSMNDRLLEEQGVKITGQYEDSTAKQTLEQLNPDIVWLPSLWPETYSFTLSIALSLGCKIAAFDIGAIAERLRALNRGQYLLPLSLANQAQQLNNYFLNAREHLND